ncbi:MAG: Rap1a/Tai family immunity protein [Sedimenticolaceae bacterium]
MKSLFSPLLGLSLWTTAVAQEGVGDAQRFFPQQLTAQQLLTHCASSSMTDRGRQQKRYCSGFVSGVEEALRFSVSSSAATVAVRICVPEREPARSMADAYIRYAGRRTTDLAKPAALVVVEALESSYPCPG